MIQALAHYHTTFDAEETLKRHEAVGRKPIPGMVVNFLGVAVDPEVYPPILRDLAGLVEPVPAPANWHADIAEWAAALRAVDLSDETFSMIELGCGWGCWINAMGTAARRIGRAVDLVGVEGEPHYLRFAEQALERNGFQTTDWTLMHGVAASVVGWALFPNQASDSRDWGMEPVMGASEEQRLQAAESGSHTSLPMLPLEQIIGHRSRIDLLHIDIQGGEVDLIEQSLDVLCRRVAYIVVGTHSRQIEGRLFNALLGAGWTLEVERPAILKLGDGPVVVIDGIQGWRNPRLLPLA